ncbi:helical backbone metal receptor [Winogradskyella sp. SYSU M77433]|nr:helical backbone metal receptor [Winogradskyella sp. SYSU M77433]MDH7911233.1 helical backbone metal receptor [Winogradskyella sp. SYSU M77433]
MVVLDQLHRSVDLKQKPIRIVSLVPSQTELLVHLGLENSVVGITKFCVHPNHILKSKTIVGGTKQIHVDKIKTLQPDIILCNKEENTPEIIESLNKVAPIHISDVNNLEDCFELIKMYGEIFEVEDRALDLIENIKKERLDFRAIIQNREKRKVAYFIWKKPWMAVASETFINCMINDAGFENVFKGEKRYPEIKLDNPKLKEAEVILLSSEPYPFKEKHIKELKLIFPDKEVVIVDGELFSWYGSRLLESYKYFSRLFA